ncbi:hypothetical protein [Hydrogenophaga sp.]|uniref:hypothetical protein n=1 Tax=Hydrogenophaga sp. TaxID=1904254 RepID=UPI002720261E|nr:hypothetical protein [Hydrogenophaga sp.]MDO9438627.1 hypothetical protein [Hydrogenophaga sp.]
MSFEKPMAILGHDPIFLAIFIAGAAALLIVQKMLKIQIHPFSIYVLFIVLLAIYIGVQGKYE